MTGCSASAIAASTGNTLKGRVVDPDGKPIPGAMVNLAEQSKMVFTDENGEFTIKDANYGDEVNATCVGYITSITPYRGFQRPHCNHAGTPTQTCMPTTHPWLSESGKRRNYSLTLVQQ